MGMMYIYYGYVYGYLYLFLFGGGWVASFKDWAKRIIPLGYFLLPPMGVSIIGIKVCTFSIGVNSFMISSIDIRVILCFGAYLLFLPRFYPLRLSRIFLRYWGLWLRCSLGNSPSVEYILCDLLRCSFLWLHPFLAECKILKYFSWLYLLRVMNTPCDLNPFLLRVCSYLIWLICLSRWFL